MHRYLPALMQRAGWKTVSVPVNHRHRASGVSKYNNLGRALVGIADMRGVAWLIRRGKVTAVEEVDRSEEHTSELQSLMRISYAAFCLNKKKIRKQKHKTIIN